jgi:hypothetical protein
MSYGRYTLNVTKISDNGTKNDSSDDIYEYTGTACGESHYGYDCDGARLGESNSMLTTAQSIIFAYNVTGNEEYALLAYNILKAMTLWEQWGPAHTLNGAEASSAFAITLDWGWRIFCDMNDRGVVDYLGDVVDPEYLMDIIAAREQ